MSPRGSAELVCGEIKAITLSVAALRRAASSPRSLGTELHACVAETTPPPQTKSEQTSKSLLPERTPWARQELTSLLPCRGIYAGRGRSSHPYRLTTLGRVSMSGQPSFSAGRRRSRAGSLVAITKSSNPPGVNRNNIRDGPLRGAHP